MEEDGRLTQTTQKWQTVKKKKKIQMFQGYKCKQTPGGLGFDSKQKHQELHTFWSVPSSPVRSFLIVIARQLFFLKVLTTSSSPLQSHLIQDHDRQNDCF